MKSYPLEIENIGDDTYALMSRGHHDIDEFMNKVRESYSWPLGWPEHIWFKAVPDRTGNLKCRYVESSQGRPGAFPVTFVQEAYGEDSFERKAEERTKGGNRLGSSAQQSVDGVASSPSEA